MPIWCMKKKLLCWLKAQINYDLRLLKGFTEVVTFYESKLLGK